VTRGTRPKKPFIRGFARKARGAGGSGGSWGLKTENRKPKFFSLFSSRQQQPKNKQIKNKIQNYFFERLHPVRADRRLRLQGRGEGREGKEGGGRGRRGEGEGEGENEGVRSDAP
jgi:hypothetical protein